MGCEGSSTRGFSSAGAGTSRTGKVPSCVWPRDPVSGLLSFLPVRSGGRRWLRARRESRRVRRGSARGLRRGRELRRLQGRVAGPVRLTGVRRLCMDDHGPRSGRHAVGPTLAPRSRAPRPDSHRRSPDERVRRGEAIRPHPVRQPGHHVGTCRDPCRPRSLRDDGDRAVHLTWLRGRRIPRRGSAALTKVARRSGARVSPGRSDPVGRVRGGAKGCLLARPPPG